MRDEQYFNNLIDGLKSIISELQDVYQEEKKYEKEKLEIKYGKNAEYNPATRDLVISKTVALEVAPRLYSICRNMFEDVIHSYMRSSREYDYDLYYQVVEGALHVNNADLFDIHLFPRGSRLTSNIYINKRLLGTAEEWIAIGNTLYPPHKAAEGERERGEARGTDYWDSWYWENYIYGTAREGRKIIKHIQKGALKPGQEKRSVYTDILREGDRANELGRGFKTEEQTSRHEGKYKKTIAARIALLTPGKAPFLDILDRGTDGLVPGTPYPSHEAGNLFEVSKGDIEYRLDQLLAEVRSWVVANVEFDDSITEEEREAEAEWEYQQWVDNVLNKLLEGKRVEVSKEDIKSVAEKGGATTMATEAISKGEVTPTGTTKRYGDVAYVETEKGIFDIYYTSTGEQGLRWSLKRNAPRK